MTEIGQFRAVQEEGGKTATVICCRRCSVVQVSNGSKYCLNESVWALLLTKGLQQAPVIKDTFCVGINEGLKLDLVLHVLR